LYRHIRTLALALATSGALSAGVLSFSNATAFNADSTGAWNHGGITATSGCCQGIVVEADAFNDGNSTVALPFDFTNGTHTLFFETSDWTAAFGVAHGGVNFFFDGIVTPGISAWLDPIFDKDGPTNAFLANSSSVTASETNSDIAGSGTLTYTNVSGASVTLTGLQWVGGSGSNPYNPGMTVIRADFVVRDAADAGVPEPGSVVLLGSALLVMGGAGRRFLLRKR
jgi:hypothetical protein